MISLTISDGNGYRYFKINIYFPPEYLSYERVSASNCELLLINSHHAHRGNKCCVERCNYNHVNGLSEHYDTPHDEKSQGFLSIMLNIISRVHLDKHTLWDIDPLQKCKLYCSFTSI